MTDGLPPGASADSTAPTPPFIARVVTLFPEAFPGTLGLSLIGRALEAGLWRLETFDLRAFGVGRHQNVDDTPAGGGPGMVLRADVVDAALRAAMAGGDGELGDWPVVALSPRGRPFDQRMAARLATGRGITLLSGRFEGIDQRVLDHWRMEEVSIGDFVMTGGEIAAEAMLDAILRLRPGVLGNIASLSRESFDDDLLEHPQYTRPRCWQGHEIPAALLGGDHERIARWRRDEARRLTRERRPDLWARHAAREEATPDRDPGRARQ